MMFPVRFFRRLSTRPAYVLTLSVVAFAAAAVTSTPASTATQFSDVRSEGWEVDAIEWFDTQRITQGCHADRFCPDEEMTREQQLTFLWRYEGSPAPGAGMPFTDVPEGKFFTDPVTWAYNAGVTEGIGNNEFGTGQPVTRAQAVTFLWRYVGETAPTDPLFFTTDVGNNTFYTDAVRWASETGVTKGCDLQGRRFCPDRPVTRAEFATFLHRLDQHLNNPATLTPYEVALARFTETSERTFVDRPDEHEGPMVKFLYVVPSFATDRERDLNGEIASYVFHANEWLASQNGGFGVRVDTFEGALDVPFVEIETTPEEWSSWFADSLAPAAELLIAEGWPINRHPEGNGDDLYYVVWEAVAGSYEKTGGNGGNCRPVIDGQNAGYRMVGFASSTIDDDPCRLDYGRFPFGGSPQVQRDFLSSTSGTGMIIGFVDHVMQLMRGLPDCRTESPHDGEPYTVPGTDMVEIRGGFIRDLLEFHDPVAMRMREAEAGTKPELDVRHDTYFHTTTGRLARTSCNSDAGRHPMWSDTPLYPESPTVPRRSVLDRPDDVEGRQLHAVYVKAAGAPDRALDTGLEIAAAMRDFDAWMRVETGGTGIRLDTFDGHLDITYLPLPMSMDEYVESGDCRGDRCPSDVDFERLLIDAGYHDPTKTYAFFYDGGISPNRLCGGARTNSRSLLINLDDFNESGCFIPWRAESLDVFGLGHLVGHELLHTLGAVCAAAPLADGGFHSSDTKDLMNAGAEGPGLRLDADRDSYWGSGAPVGCDVSTDEIFTTEANLEPRDGTTLDSVPVGFNTMQPSSRTWWLDGAHTATPSFTPTTIVPSEPTAAGGAEFAMGHSFFR